MIRYDHARHAGNFADVHKHLVLWVVLKALQESARPLVAMDLYAGAGQYDLTGELASSTGEWEQGIGRLWRVRGDVARGSPLEGYIASIAAWQSDPGRLRSYPGSPVLLQAGLRERDSLVACEPHADPHAVLQQTLRSDARCQVHQVDALHAVRTEIPPRRRGLGLLDPPYKRQYEYMEVVRIARLIRARWHDAVIMIWYPVMSARLDRFLRGTLIAEMRNPWLVSELRMHRDPSAHAGLSGSGVLILNPPCQLEARLEEALLPVHTLLDPDGLGGLYMAAGLENVPGDPTLRAVKPI
ncbi:MULTISPECIES: 23S rRNA (adenine(2030)-N(6))-methyltransferase RlmJ [unclassified Thioalkalivibrio]|uniref:23S rRNA (adenine(2030)-N(6))-methyltransferase RlmJ n=1 Tax=unclassified Thioalkalivibrio TaxID=2621013 RepID=UPI00037C2D2B|nr:MULTISPECIES: 23S rRNA (adenine(2030)-N(6))-methyltransferase RlmJ [unclassified Thioalkalivibrio]